MKKILLVIVVTLLLPCLACCQNEKLQDSDRDGLVNSIDPDPQVALVYEVPVDYLDEEMKKDAIACIEDTDKIKTFENLSQLVYKHVPHAMHPPGRDQYPNATLYAKLDPLRCELDSPRDPLSYYYSHHEKVLVPPVCNDIALVYDLMADFIIKYTGWDEEGEKKGNNGVDSDVFPCFLDRGTHFIVIINIEGEEYVADAVYGILFKLEENPDYDLSLDNGMAWRHPVWLLMAKFDRRYLNTIYDKNPINTDVIEGLLWEMLRNQTPENEEELYQLYLKLLVHKSPSLCGR